MFGRHAVHPEPLIRAPLPVALPAHLLPGAVVSKDDFGEEEECVVCMLQKQSATLVVCSPAPPFRRFPLPCSFFPCFLPPAALLSASAARSSPRSMLLKLSVSVFARVVISSGCRWLLVT